MIGAWDAARAIGVHANTLKRIPPAELPFCRVGSRGDRRYSEADVSAYLHARREGGPAAGPEPEPEPERREPVLTPRQMEALTLASTGRSRSEIAAAMGVSDSTAIHHIQQAMERLGVGTRMEAVVEAGILVRPPAADRRTTCGTVMACGRLSGHRGHHGGFRPVARAER